MGDNRVEVELAIGDGGQVSISFTADDGTYFCKFESSQLEDSYAGDLLYLTDDQISFLVSPLVILQTNHVIKQCEQNNIYRKITRS